MKKFDMHFHSTRSDGENTHEERIIEAKKRGLKLITLTDHDIVTNDDFINQARSYGISSNKSVEISARDYDLNKSLHLTSYANTFNEGINDILKDSMEERKIQTKDLIEKLQSKGFKGTLEGLFKYMKEKKKVKLISKFNIVEYLYTFPENLELIKTIVGKDIKKGEFLREFLKGGGDYYNEYGIGQYKMRPSIEKCNQVVQKTNAILSIAHPNFTFKKEGILGFQTIFPKYYEKGVNAIEVSSKASKEWVEAIYDLKKRFNIILTAGSDNHCIYYVDDKHSDYGELNPYLSEKDKEEIYKEYIKFLSL